jgi:hypothetical protein
MSILGKFKDKVAQSFIEAGNRSKEAINLANLKAQVWMLEKQRNHLYFELGREYYKMKLAGAVDELGLNFIVVQLRETDDAVSLNQAKIKEILDEAKSRITEVFTPVTIQCQCGSIIDDGTKFCGFCGANVENLLKEMKDPGKNQTEKFSQFCGICGIPKDNDDVFCSNCGSPLS